MTKTQHDERTIDCKDCGEPVTYQPTVFAGREIGRPSRCDGCNEERDRRLEEEERRLEEKRKAEKLEWRKNNIHRLLHDAGVNPWAHGDATFDAWTEGSDDPGPMKATKDFMQAILEADKYDPVRGLYLYGTTGTGKTYLASALVRALLLHGWKPGDVCMDHAASFITEVQDCYGSDRSVLATKAKRVNARLWVLDDLGTERASDDVVRILTEILNAREGRPTMVTSNLRPDKLEERHPELGRVVSRLGPRNYRYVEVSGRDHRFDAA